MTNDLQQELFDIGDTLLPCIVCDGLAMIHTTNMGRNMYYVRCIECGKNSGYSYRSRSKAAGLWNMQNNPNRG